MNKFAASKNIETSISPGAKKAWKRKMFTVIGNNTTVASGTNFPTTRAMPQINSSDFNRGIKYPETNNPVRNC
jgi:hypothetical protein